MAENNDRIAVAVLGNRSAGKSRTWNTLFGETVKTGNRIRRLFLTPTEFVDVFLVSGSPEERNLYVGDIIQDQAPRIVLCSMQYRDGVQRTIDYFVDNGYSLFVQWLNPGFSDEVDEDDTLGLMPYLLDRGGIVSVRDGHVPPAPRVQELSDFIYGWARSRGLIRAV